MDPYEVLGVLHRAADTEVSRQPLEWDPAALRQIHLKIDAGGKAILRPSHEQLGRARSNVSEMITSAGQMAKGSGRARVEENVVVSLLAKRKGIWPWT